MEFGGSVDLDVGVASGGVRVTGGTYFSWQKSPAKIVLSAFVRSVGALEFLGLVAITVDIYIGLDYVKEGGQSALWGRARMSVEVEVPIPFGSISVSFEVERRFAGSDGDPPFSAAWDGPEEWISASCAAFEGMIGELDEVVL